MSPFTQRWKNKKNAAVAETSTPRAGRKSSLSSQGSTRSNPSGKQSRWSLSKGDRSSIIRNSANAVPVGNTSLPIYMNNGKGSLSSSHLTPQITSVHSSQHNRNRSKIFGRGKKDHSGSSSEEELKNREVHLDQIGDAVIAIASGNESAADEMPTKQSSAKHSKLTLGNASDVEAHMANENSTTNLNGDDSSHWGILSSFINVAQHAASNLGTITNGPHNNMKSHPKETDTNSAIDTRNFGDHLDSLLSDSKPQASLDGDEGSQLSRSNAHDIQFQPVRETVIGSMGKGGLTLEDLGFSEPGNPFHKIPHIEVDNGSLSRSSMTDEDPEPDDAAVPVPSRTLNFDSTTKTEPIMSTVTGNSNGTASVNGISSLLRSHSTKSLSRSMSPPLFRRSLSPNGLKQVNSFQNSAVSRPNGHRTSIGSMQDALSLTASNVSIASPPSVLPSVELKNISFASPKRNNEFHSNFKKIPKHEKLIEDYSCALQRDILVQGRMYISERHIGFKSNILGWVTNIAIPIHEIVQLEKKTTAGLFPNGIVIQTLHQKYIFASLLQRDTTFELITNIWNQLVRGSLGLDEGDVLLNMDNVSRKVGSRSDLEYDESDEDSHYDDEDTSLSENDDNDSDNDSIDDDMVMPTDAVLKHPPTEPEHDEVSGEIKILEDIISAPLPKVYQLLFGKDSSYFTSVLTKQKNKNISNIPEFQSKDGVLTREYTYVKPLIAPVGPKETECQVTETIDHKDFDSYVLCTQTTRTPDVPSGGSFSVVTQLYFSWGSKNSTKFTVYTYMNWTGKSWIKAAINKGSIDGQKESIGILVDELKSKTAPGEKSIASDDSGTAGSDLPLVGPKTHAASSFSPNIPSTETTLLEETLSAPLGTIYSIIFEPSYLKNIITAQKNFDLTEISKFPEQPPKERQYTYTKPLNGPIGPKQTKCQITETIETFDLNSHIHVVQSVSTPDIPSGGSFSVKTNFYLMWAESNQTKFVVSTFVNWTGKSWIKGTIEKGSIDGQKESIAVLISEVKNTLASSTSSKRRKRSKSVAKPGKKGTSEMDDTLKRISGPTRGYNISIPGLGFITGSGAGSLGFFLVVLVLIVFILKTWVSSGANGDGGGGATSIRLDGSSRVMIGGSEFLIIPTIDNSLKDRTRRLEEEHDIWDWIQQRSGEKGAMPTEGADFAEKHKRQDLTEMVRVAEQCLEKLKMQVDAEQIET